MSRKCQSARVSEPDAQGGLLYFLIFMKKILLLVSLVLIGQNVPAATEFDVRMTSEFHKIVPANAELKKLGGGLGFVEGPTWFARDGGYLIFSDIPGEKLMKWSAKDGLTTYRVNTHGANGNCVDRDGRLITCEHLSRRVTRTEKDGTIETLVERYEGGRFNSPNDVVVKSDRTVWFSDPDYGLGNAPREVPGMYVYRLWPKTGKIMPVVKDCDHPNGLCFSPDEKRLYVADSGKPHQVMVYDVKKDGTLSNGRVFCVIDKGVPDGMRCDATGRLFSSAGDGVQIFDENGQLIGKILVPETPANLCFGGKDRKTLFITARTSLYCIELNVQGAKVGN
jgi:gluconolactonase